jgi:hypothetical protein
VLTNDLQGIWRNPYRDRSLTILCIILVQTSNEVAKATKKMFFLDSACPSDIYKDEELFFFFSFPAD